MKLQWCGVIYFMILIHEIVCGTGPAHHYDITVKNGKRMKALGTQLKLVKSMLNELTEEKETCVSELAAVTDQLKILTNKIGKLTNVDVDVSGYSDAPSVVSVKVSCGYERCLRGLKGSPITDANAKIWCLRSALWEASLEGNEREPEIMQMTILPPPEEDEPMRAAFEVRNGLIIAPEDMSQPPSGFRTRREYRTLSLEERQRFHDALNVLYQDGVINTMARIHRKALRSKGAHEGPAFLPWHRAFLSFFEEALRQVDPTVFLPYWDSSIDDNMPGGPGFSVMWDEDHLGQGSDIVNFGPFAGWITANSPLRRQIARGVGSLIRQSRINTVMSFCRRSDFDRRWENAHNGVHRWIGGTMARPLSASDPVFYMHHAFIDYQWEKFREHQISDCNIHPAYDYPPTDDINHQPDTEMDGMNFLLNKDGIADYWTTNWYNYEDTPTCATNCGNNPDMFCDTQINLCVGEVRFDLSSYRKKRQTETPKAVGFTKNADKICSKNPYHPMCPQPLYVPSSDEEYVEALLVDEFLPPGIGDIEDAMDQEFDRGFEFPPDSGPIVFKAAIDEPNDCRSIETSTYDLLSVVVRGTKVSNKGYSAEMYENPNKRG